MEYSIENSKEIEYYQRKKEKLEKKIANLRKNKLYSYYLEKYNNELKLINKTIEYFQTLPKKEAKVKKALAKEKKKRYQILNGNITQAIIMVCFPLAVYGFFNSFYSLIDSMMSSLIKDAATGSGAVNISNVAVISQLKSMISAFGAGIAGGGGVLVSRFYGSGKLNKARKAASNMVFISVILSLVLLLVLAPSASLILQIAQVPTINSDVILYFEFILIELILVAINNIFICLEKIKGNSKKILILNILALMIKLLMNTIFIFGFHVNKIIFLEIATIIGQAFIFIYGIFVLFGNKNLLKISIKEMKPERDLIIKILKLSIPIFLGKFVMSLGKAIVNARCGLYYAEATEGLITGALGISNNLSGLVTSTTNVFEEGESTIVSQNIGNKNLKRTIKAFIRTLIIVAIISLIGFILVRYVFLDSLTSLFNRDGSEKMSQYVKEIFVYDCISIPSLGLTSALLGLLYGYGKTFLSSILNFSRIGIRIISLVVCQSIGLNYQAAGISMGISNILIGVLALIFLIIFLVSLYKKGYRDMKVSDKEPVDLGLQFE